MTTKPKARKFRIRRPDGIDPAARGAGTANAGQAAPAQAGPAVKARVAPKAMTIDEIRQEGLTGRQLRMARRVAQKHGLAATSDFDAVRQLRAAGIDPFQQSTILELVAPKGGTVAPGAAPQPPAVAEGRVQLPQTLPNPDGQLPSTERIDPSQRRAVEIGKIQKDISRRRRRKLALLLTRLAIFVGLPTLLAGYYFAVVATPMYATNSEFVIQQAESGGTAGGLGGLFQGTSMATQQDSIAVQSYLESRAAMVRLDEEHGFKAHFSDASIDPIQRLEPDATNEAAFKLYSDKVKISYDPTEGILRMEVIAADPATSQQFSEALIGYAEEQVDQLTQRLRGDQMAGARESYEAAEQRRTEALDQWLNVQQQFEVIDPLGETGALTGQISALEQQRQQLQLTLSDRLNVSRPNQAQVDALRGQIANIENLIADLRQQMTSSGSSSGASLAARNTELRLAEENYAFQTVLVQQALTQMEAAQIEANRQVRYLSLGVEPVAPDEATYPRVFENTVLTFLIFAGLYLMISITASILREQVTS